MDRPQSESGAAAHFHRLCDLPPEQRRAELEALEADSPTLAELVRGLLDADTEPSPILDATAREALNFEAGAPRQVGEFELDELLGEGGMGVVYRARQTSPRREVALKLLRTGLVLEDRLRRFEHEAEILGWLNHPGIAQVFAAGTATTESGPQPYIAMELVEGLPIDRYANGRSLSHDARLALVLELCAAVDHAHEKGVIHRDLKPANVLVTRDGQLKVLDFGIARIMDPNGTNLTSHTAVGEVLGTLPYMSPEQVGGEPSAIDVRTDVYAIGAIAYELLGGQRPLDVSSRSLAEAARAITEDDPTTLGALDPALRGDVEVVIGKALAKDKSDRYASPSELANDIQRFLRQEPVLARRPSRWIYLAKFARRNRALVAATLTAILALAAGAVISTVQLLAKADEAEASRATLAFLESLFEQTHEDSDGQLTIDDVTIQAAERINDEFADRPRVRGRLLSVVGGALNELELFERSEPLLEEAVQLQGEVHGESSPEVAAALMRYAKAVHMLKRTGSEAQAYGAAVRALAIHERRESGPADLAEALLLIASIEFKEQPVELVRERTEKAIDLYRSALPEGAPETLFAELTLANLDRHDARFEASRTRLEALLSAVAPEYPKLRLEIGLEYGRLLKTVEREEEAETQLREALEATRTLPPFLDLVREATGELALVVSELRRPDEAFKILEDSVAATTAEYGPESVRRYSALYDLAFILHDLPDKERAIRTYEECIEGFSRLSGPGSLEVLATQYNLGFLYAELGQWRIAEDLTRKAYNGRLKLDGPDALWTGYARQSLMTILGELGEYEEAASLGRDQLTRSIRDFGPAAERVQYERIVLANCLISLGDHPGAHALLDDFEAAMPAAADPDRFRSALDETRAAAGPRTR